MSNSVTPTFLSSATVSPDCYNDFASNSPNSFSRKNSFSLPEEIELALDALMRSLEPIGALTTLPQRQLELTRTTTTRDLTKISSLSTHINTESGRDAPCPELDSGSRSCSPVSEPDEDPPSF